MSGRFHIIETGNRTIVDDCYNANPVSMKASLDVLQDALGRRVAILGDMGELGKRKWRCTGKLGCMPLPEILIRSSAWVNWQGIWLRQPGWRTYKDIVHFAEKESLLEALPEMIRDGDTILVKASHFMEFEKVVEMLKDFPCN
ncbi:MAG: glutamate ligase domain-containing protein [Blautia marasmi]